MSEYTLEARNSNNSSIWSVYFITKDFEVKVFEGKDGSVSFDARMSFSAYLYKFNNVFIIEKTVSVDYESNNMSVYQTDTDYYYYQSNDNGKSWSIQKYEEQYLKSVIIAENQICRCKFIY